MRCVVSCGGTSFPWLVFLFGALLWGSMIHKHTERWIWQGRTSDVSWNWEKYYVLYQSTETKTNEQRKSRRGRQYNDQATTITTITTTNQLGDGRRKVGDKHHQRITRWRRYHSGSVQFSHQHVDGRPREVTEGVVVGDKDSELPCGVAEVVGVVT